MKNLKTIKCWGIPYGLTSQQQQTEEVTIEARAHSIKEFKKKMKEGGHKLTSRPYMFLKK